nr:PAS domain-containing protein [Gemmatimonadaceae bacterium]
LDEIEAPEAMRVLVPAARRVLAGERITFQLPVRGRTLELRGVPLTDDGAAARGALILGIDVTERERARAALEASEQKLRTAVELATEGIYEWDVVNDRVIGSTKLSRHLGYGPGTASPTVSAWFELVHPDDAPRARALLDRHLEGRSPGYETEYRVRAANGEWRWLHDRAQVVERDADGRPLWVLGANADITDRKRTEGALRAIAATSGAPGSDAKLFSELVERLATMLELRAACIAERDAERSTVLRLLGSWAEGAAHDERTVDIAGTLLAPVLDGGDAPSAGGPTIATTLWGIDADDHTIVPLRDDRGLTIGLLLAVGGGARLDGGMAGSLLQTIAARATGELVRRRAEARLRERERELADAQRIGRIGGYAWHGPEGRLVWTDETYRLLGHVPGTVVASAALFREAIHPDDAATVRAGLDHVMATRAPHWRAEYRIRRADDGSVRWIASQGEFEYDATGAVRHVRGVHVDITDQRVLEERLRQSQKLEAVGQLAGGLAHDFNNLLTVVRGHARFLLRALPEGSEARRDADAIRVASERAAGLTRQLLTLSRRDASVPRRIAADTIIARYAELLGRVLGEHVALELHLGAGTTRAILLDPMHLEQVLLNLGLNARDAMADSGTLTITTTYLGPAAVDFPAPRGVVRLQVRDTGAGMDPATVARAFEPFFTTKPSGHGTGIGLATVHNIVEQGGGRIWIDSVPAAGTTVTLVFPVTDGAPESLDEAPAAGPSGEPARGTVLLVEDEPDVRALARRTLEDAGYDVLVAEHGLDAVERWLEAAAAGRQVDVLVSDIRMPRMTGRELARALRAEDGELPIVLMSATARALAASLEQT